MIYQGANQKSEPEIFSHDHLPASLSRFLDLISKRVTLKGFSKFRGDLDTKDDLHGEHSYYTEYENHEIMFNVAPMIPSSKAGGQYIERKGLIGNAFVCIIFQEPGAVFTPDLISGRVTQIYIIIEPTIIENEHYYKVNNSTHGSGGGG